MICVVIPYFQREPGILHRASPSVVASQGIDQIFVIVVVNSSPIPAREEVNAIGSVRFHITVIERASSGPGGARNTGLAQLPAGMEYVAFLDSDDEWSSQYLKDALIALRAGYDIYFADYLQLGAETSAFRRANRLIPADQVPIAGQENLHADDGDMFDQIISGNVIGASTVVFDKCKFSDVRFRNDLKMAGENYLFWLDLSLRGGRFAFWSATEVVYGKGVDVFAGLGCGTDNNARRIVNEQAFPRLLLTHFPLLDHQRSKVAAGINRLHEIDKGLFQSSESTREHRLAIEFFGAQAGAANHVQGAPNYRDKADKESLINQHLENRL